MRAREIYPIGTRVLRILMHKLKNIFRKYTPFLRPLWAVVRNWRPRILTWRPRYESDELITSHLCEFTKDERFLRSYRVAMRGGHAEGLHRPSYWTNHVTCWAAEHGARLEGDFVECGVLRGFTSRMIMEYVDFEKLDKKFYLVDTYKGLDERFLSPQERVREFGYSDIYPYVKEAFSKIHNAVVVRGSVPDVLSILPPIKKGPTWLLI